MRRILILIVALLLLASLVLAQGGALFIDWPADQTVVSGTVEVPGSAFPEGLQSYFIEVAPYDPDSDSPPQWTPISLPTRTAVVYGPLTFWDTTTVPDGVYQLRLHVVLVSGESVYYVVGPIGVANTGTVEVEGPVQVLATPDIALEGAFPTAVPTQAVPTPTPEPTNVPRPNPVNTLPVELGGHVLYFTEDTQELMRETGMIWVKWQIPFIIDSETNFAHIARDRINASHAAGFRVLLSITGEVEELREYGDEYYPIFAEFLGEVAAYGPDAIEVWNEMNLDREWPTGRIDPRAYADMLRPASEAIRAVDPDVMIITGALAPTGAEGAFGLSRVWNDDRYYLGMANAGVADYADCIGLHYNEGIISPAQFGGDPREPDYPTRYFQPMLDRVWWPFRNIDIPLCITELGYLSPDGFGRLPSDFGWAANTSVDEQADWLAEAVTIAAEYDNADIALFIVWNVDFDQFDRDPQAGYAIIRPDGTCPACATIGALRSE